jgi:hypothetical protein
MRRYADGRTLRPARRQDCCLGTPRAPPEEEACDGRGDHKDGYGDADADFGAGAEAGHGGGGGAVGGA